MRELDELLLRFLDSGYARASAEEKAGFRLLLELPDPDLVGYLLYRQQPESDALVRIVRSLRGETAH